MRTAFALNALLAVCAVCSAQTNPQNVPQPPTAELQKFEPFLGKYNVSGDFANLPWAGTLELKKVIKGWYIEQIIHVKSPGIDREFWVLATWDKSAQKFRLWGFQTLPTTLEGDIRFEKGEMITEWTTVRPDGAKVLASNRYHFMPGDELEIVSDVQVGDAPIQRIGTLRGKRVGNAEQVTTAAVTDAQRRWEEAFKQGDLESMQLLLAEDDLQTDFRGVFQDKVSWLQDFKRAAANVRSTEYSFDDEKVRAYGNAAVVTGRLTAKGVRKGTPFNHVVRFTTVWVKRGGAWQLVSYQATPIEPQ